MHETAASAIAKDKACTFFIRSARCVFSQTSASAISKVLAPAIETLVETALSSNIDETNSHCSSVRIPG